MIHCLQSLVLFIATIGSSSDLIYYLVLLLLLLLSGDVELNPGPMIDHQPDLIKLNEWLEPLVDWQPFGLLLPGITQWTIKAIEQLKAKHQKLALFTKWLNTNPTASWRDVINALKQCKENELARTIEDKVTDLTEDMKATMTSMYSAISAIIQYSYNIKQCYLELIMK